MKRLLAVSWEMPPMYGPRATQVSRTVGELAARGWRPTVITMAPRRGGPHWCDGVSAEPPAGIEMRRVPSPQEWFAVRALWRMAPPLAQYPDTARVWAGRAAREAVRAAASGEYAGLITFAPPWSDHLIGARVRRQASLPWVAHFSDPWADSPYASARQRRIWGPMEAETIERASALVFVTDETRDLVMAKYRSPQRAKAFVVPHGIDFGEAATLQASSPQAGDRRRDWPVRLVYTGRFYAGQRTPLPLFRALAMLNARAPLAGRIEVLLVGPHIREFSHAAEQSGVAPLVQFRDRVAPAEASRIAAAADALLVIDAPSDSPNVFLPSKLIDYLAYRKPIVGITPNEGTSARLLRRLGCPVAPPDDVPAIAAALEKLLQRASDGALSVSDAFDDVRAEYDIKRTTDQLHRVLVDAFGR